MNVNLRIHTADIDECDIKEDICEHNCINTEGSFNCSCREGYLLSTDGRNCTGECIFGAVMSYMI